MFLWFVLSLMTGAAAFVVLWPLSRRHGGTGYESDIAVYRDQLDEVRRDLTAGLIGEKEAAAAEREIARRLIAAEDASIADVRPMQSGATKRRRMTALATLVLLPFGAGGLYLALGSPTLFDRPVVGGPAASPAAQSIERLVAQVEAHLERQPDDGRGWELIAAVYLRLGRFEDAVRARRTSLRLNGENADRVAALGEALVFAANGVVTAEAKAEFVRAVQLDSAQVQARYFLGLAAEQEGDRTQAAAIWRALLENASSDAPWAEFVRRALDRVLANADVRPIGPTQEQIAASSQTNPGERNAMIRAMLERLAERMAREGSDPKGWLRLVRSYMVLDEPDNARAVVSEARRALAADPAKLRQFEDRLKALGLQG